MPEVLLVSDSDWANLGKVLEQSLCAYGIDAEAVTLNLHGFNYTRQAREVKRSELTTLCKKSATIISMHSRNVVGARTHLAVFHGGAQYRKNPTAINAVFNPMVDFTIIQTGDLLGLGAKNEAWILPAVNLDAIKPKFGVFGKKIKVGHHPRSFQDKGGAAVVRVMNRLKKNKELRDRFIFTSDSTRVPWEQSIERMGACDIYIECLAPTHLGKIHGAWGVTALEVAALGKVCVTNFLHKELYEKLYGPCGLQVANDEDELERVMIKLLSLSAEEIENLQVDTREWAETYHSFKAIGERLWEAIQFYCYGKGKLKLNGIIRVEGAGYSGYVPPVAPEACDDPNDSVPIIPLPPCDTSRLYSPRHFWENYPGGPPVRWNERTPYKTVEDEHFFIMNALSTYGGIRQGGTISAATLEVGQGLGQTFLFLRNRGLKFESYQAVDISNTARYQFRQLTGENLPDWWDGETLGYEDCVYGVVLATDVLLHVEPDKIGRVVNELARVVSSNGVIIASSYIGTPENNKRGMLLAPHCFVHDYAGLWKMAGLTIVEERNTADGARQVWVLRKGRG